MRTFPVADRGSVVTFGAILSGALTIVIVLPLGVAGSNWQLAFLIFLGGVAISTRFVGSQNLRKAQVNLRGADRPPISQRQSVNESARVEVGRRSLRRAIKSSSEDIKECPTGEYR
jgi:hypothetical protein